MKTLKINSGKFLIAAIIGLSFLSAGVRAQTINCRTAEASKSSIAMEDQHPIARAPETMRPVHNRWIIKALFPGNSSRHELNQLHRAALVHYVHLPFSHYRDHIPGNMNLHRENRIIVRYGSEERS